MPAKAQLYYYAATGRANAIRLALAAANIPFEDVYPSGGFPPSPEDKAKWRELGGNTTTNIPLLLMPDGKVYTQSQAILRAVGRMSDDLLPKDDDGLYAVDKLMDDAESLRQESYKCFKMWGATQEKCDEFVATTLPKHLGNLERQLKASGGKYFLGDTLTLADVACYDAVVNMGANRAPGALGAFPSLKAWTATMETENEGIKKYLGSESYSKIMKFGPETLGK